MVSIFLTRYMWIDHVFSMCWYICIDVYIESFRSVERVGGVGVPFFPWLASLKYMIKKPKKVMRKKLKNFSVFYLGKILC